MSEIAPNQEIVHYLKNLRDKICSTFEKLENSSEKFERKNWQYQKGFGGGEISVMRGNVFEKAAVNWSGVGGDTFPMDDSSGAFFATGVSLITHMKNPKAPTVHFNIRYIQTEKKSWFGGGFDLTPMGFPREEDTIHFHKVAKKSLDPYGADLHSQFFQWAQKYYYIPHYQKERGVGGIFFDHLNLETFDQTFSMWKSVGDHFLEAIMPIYEKRIHENYTDEDKLIQLKQRAHYVEFNLLYDRGTKFGFQSGGNPEAILCSMPPLAAW
jgi:coproporphyrinogen III oxidase